MGINICKEKSTESEIPRMQRIRKVVLRSAVVFIFLATSPNFANASPAKVIRVYDGDTLRIILQGEKVSIRLYGIDAPESGQAGNVSATRFLKRLVLEQPVEIKVIATDAIGRSLAIVIREGKEPSVNAAMVGNGYSWVNPGKCKVDECTYWKKLESQAKKLKLGIWSGFDLVPPWEFKLQGN